MFRYAETLKDATRRQGGQYQPLVFDERMLVTADVVAFLESRLRPAGRRSPCSGSAAARTRAAPGMAR